MIMSKTTMYAMRAVLFLASKKNGSDKVGIKDISDGLDIPFHFLGKILQQLSRHHIISSIKGPGGGFFMTQAQLDLPMMNLFEIFEGPEYFNQCGLGLKECSEKNPCPIHFQYKPFREYFRSSLRMQSIEQWTEKVNSGDVKLKS